MWTSRALVLLVLAGMVSGAVMLLRAGATGDAAQATIARLENELAEKNAALAELRRSAGNLERRLAEMASAAPPRRAADLAAAARPEGKAPAPATGHPAPRELAAVEWLRSLGPDRFAAMTPAALSALTELDLSGMRLTDGDLAHLAAMPNLKTLQLRGADVDDLALRHLAGLRLQVLSLRGTKVTGSGLASLPVEIEHLDLTDTQAGAGGWQRVSPLPRLATLKMNRLLVTDADLEVLPRFPRLRHLEIDGTQVSERGVRRLLELNPDLTRIEVRGTPLTRAMIAEIKTRYPRVDLVADATDRGQGFVR